MTDRHREAYREEAGELLAELETALLELEERPDDRELVGRVFRALHTIKGSGSMFGFDAIASFTHGLETAFDNVREGRIPVTPELVNVTLSARDHIQSLLGASGPQEAELAPAGAQILERMRQAAPLPVKEEAPAATPVPAISPLAAPVEGELHTYRIHFEPEADIFLSGTNPVSCLNELAEMGELSLAAHLDRIPHLEDLNPEACYTYWDAMLSTTADENAVRDVFIFVEDRARVEIERVHDVLDTADVRLGAVLVDRGEIEQSEVEKCLGERPLTGELLVQAGLLSRGTVDAAIVEQQHLRRMKEKRDQVAAAASLRVPAAKLDSLVNVVGELVTVQARMSDYALRSGDVEAGLIAEEIERLSELLRESTMSLRMLPISDTFNRFRRLVRDLSTELGKRVELHTEGGDTELDKTVIEQLNDPLVHLVRNSIDHGIETPEKRSASGKLETGNIRLTASHAGAFVLIQIADDGAGLNRTAIRERAIERGLISPEAILTDQETDALIMAAGFSTASQVTSISGRGVGMDVVKRSIDALRGTLTIASTPGRGTIVTLKIPLTLAIIDGLLVEAGNNFFVVPLANISECIELSRGKSDSSREKLVSVRGELVPYIVLRDRFNLPGEPPAIEQVIVAETPNGRFGFVVDRVIGDHHTVIKKLGNLYRHVDEVSGATILGDGSVALIIDVDKVAGGAIQELCHA